jgi:hypothetical protein
MTTPDLEPTREDVLRERAVKQLKKRRDFKAHLLVYAMFNSFFVVIWYVLGHHFFWPIFPMAGWGIGVVMNAWDVYHGEDFTEDEIAREMQRLTQHK